MPSQRQVKCTGSKKDIDLHSTTNTTRHRQAVSTRGRQATTHSWIKERGGISKRQKQRGVQLLSSESKATGSNLPVSQHTRFYCSSLMTHLELAESFVLALAQSAEPRLGRFFVEKGLFPAALELLLQSLDPLVCPRVSAVDIDFGRIAVVAHPLAAEASLPSLLQHPAPLRVGGGNCNTKREWCDSDGSGERKKATRPAAAGSLLLESQVLANGLDKLHLQAAGALRVSLVTSPHPVLQFCHLCWLQKIPGKKNCPFRKKTFALILFLSSERRGAWIKSSVVACQRVGLKRRFSMLSSVLRGQRRRSALDSILF